MKSKLLMLTLLLIPLFLNGQGIKRPNEIKIPTTDTFLLVGSDTFSVRNLDSISYQEYRIKFKEYLEANENNQIIIDTTGSIILVGPNYAVINEKFAREDLQEDMAKDTLIKRQKEQITRQDSIILLQKEEAAVKDSIINSLYNRVNMLSDIVVICEKDRKKKTFAVKVFQWSFVAMCGAAFVLGVQ